MVIGMNRMMPMIPMRPIRPVGDWADSVQIRLIGG